MLAGRKKQPDMLDTPPTCKTRMQYVQVYTEEYDTLGRNWQPLPVLALGCLAVIWLDNDVH